MDVHAEVLAVIAAAPPGLGFVGDIPFGLEGLGDAIDHGAGAQD